MIPQIDTETLKTNECLVRVYNSKNIFMGEFIYPRCDISSFEALNKLPESSQFYIYDNKGKSL